MVKPKSSPKSAPRRKVAEPAGEPVLLAGGNPRIAKGEGDAPVEEYLAALPGWKREAGRRLDAVITRAGKPVTKAVKWNSPFYGREGRGWFVAMHAYTKFLRLTFFRGASLRPLPPGESKSADVRHFDLREGEPLDERRLADWVKQASRLPGWGRD